MIFISNEHSNFPTKVVNIIKNQNPFPVWDLSIKEMESSFSAGYQVNSAILVKQVDFSWVFQVSRAGFTPRSPVIKLRGCHL